MIRKRASAQRGRANHGWLDTRYSFSFADYLDPEHMGFRALRVINEDRVAPGQGFPTHAHRDMEILTWVLAGELEHKDSMGNGSRIRPGELQRMSAGTGVTHSEFNPSGTDALHLLQIWVLPERSGLEPSYEQRAFSTRAGSTGERAATLLPIASPDGRDGSLRIHQDVVLSAASLPAGSGLTVELRPERHAWLQVAKGALSLNGLALQAGDGAAVSDETELNLVGNQDADLLLFDLA